MQALLMQNPAWRAGGHARRWLREQPLLYRGSAVTCPVCDGTYRTFVPQGGRRNARCPDPTCRTVERHRVVWLFLAGETNLLDGGLRLLHFAPEPALQARFRVAPDLSYTSADLDSPLADVHTDIQDLPFDDGEFDVILCSHVLEHVPDDARALSELRRVLRPGGTAILLYPVDPAAETTYEDPRVVTPEERQREFGQDDHVRMYGRDNVDRVRSAGFHVEERRYLDELPAATRDRFGIAERDLIPLNRDPLGRSVETCTMLLCRPAGDTGEATLRTRGR